jgi:cell division protein FtsB
MATTTTVQDLEKRIAALEAGCQYQADRAVVQAVEGDHLVQLRTLRVALAADAAGGSAATTREMQALRDENERLKTTVAKLRYRVEHLVDGMEEMMAAAPKPASA